MDTPGQLNGRALAAWRKGRAVELALAGCDYDTIAERVGYAHRATAWKAVQAALGERAAAGVDEYRAVTLERYERLVQAHWEGALSGSDPKSAVVLKVLAAQSKLLGLEARPGDVVDQHRTVVVGGTSEEYIAALRSIAGPPQLEAGAGVQ